MKVYIVVMSDYDFSEVVGVYNKQELAEKKVEIEKAKDKAKYGKEIFYYEICEEKVLRKV